MNRHRKYTFLGSARPTTHSPRLPSSRGTSTPASTTRPTTARPGTNPAPSSRANRRSRPSSATAWTCTSTLPLGTKLGGARWLVSASSAPIACPPAACLCCLDVEEVRMDNLRPSVRNAEEEATPRTTSTEAMVTWALPSRARSTLPDASVCAGSAGLYDARGSVNDV